jgi:hypothetical protein
MPGSLSTPSLFAVWSCHPGGRSPACFWPTSGLPTIQLQSGRVVPNGFIDRFASLRTQLLALLGGLGEDD